jgi:hypothetical protein
VRITIPHFDNVIYAREEIFMSRKKFFSIRGRLGRILSTEPWLSEIQVSAFFLLDSSAHHTPTIIVAFNNVFTQKILSSHETLRNVFPR